MMLLDVKKQVASPEISQLLEYAVYPDEEALSKAIQRYEREEDLELYVLKNEDELIGIIGFQIDEERVLTITHLAISPEHRDQGYGRGIILEVLYAKEPERIIAETDEDAVDFYRSIGFEIVSLGRLAHGVERFRCTYETEPQED
ncbi:GNAT family N-acetyltransferase [Paenibacillus sp. J22TS3]|uniref:GNAT family N-acetyltransferase n=1 Tax=Paenibacillus sp. J22TS3 TaxID=2807192 RepID=UPI001FD4468D|nr:GNAT family N-acetyltransferase [Paenibacillus sp. J22TS3]